MLSQVGMKCYKCVLHSIMGNCPIILKSRQKDSNVNVFWIQCTLFVTFSISPLLFESVEQEDQAFLIQKKDMQHIYRVSQKKVGFTNFDIV